MNNTGLTIAKNASALMISQLFTWGLALVMMIFLPRFLGPSGVGNLHLATSIWAIVSIAISFGMDMMMTKEIARSPEKTDELFGTSIILRAIFSIFGFGLVAFYTWQVGYPQITVYVILIIGIASLIGQFTSACQASLKGLERMEYVSISDIVGKMIATFISIALLIMGYGVLVIAAVVILGALVSFSIQYVALRKLQPLSFKFDWQTAVWMLKSSFPYLLINIVLVVYIQIDIIIISLFVNEDGVGWYGAADRLFATFLFIPTVFMAAVFPALSRLYKSSPNSLPRIMSKSFDLLLLLGTPIGLGVLVIAVPLVSLLFGAEFDNSGAILAIMGIVLILTYQNMMLGQFMISTDRQNTWTVVMAIAIGATIILDLILIPWFQVEYGNGAIGGAVAFVVTELGMLVTGIRLLPKGTLDKNNAWFAARVLLAGFIMAAAVWLLRDVFILVPIIVGVIVYLVMILLLRVIPKEDWIMLKGIVISFRDRFMKRSSEPAGMRG